METWSCTASKREIRCKRTTISLDCLCRRFFLKSFALSLALEYTAKCIYSVCNLYMFPSGKRHVYVSLCLREEQHFLPVFCPLWWPPRSNCRCYKDRTRTAHWIYSTKNPKATVCNRKVPSNQINMHLCFCIKCILKNLVLSHPLVGQVPLHTSHFITFVKLASRYSINNSYLSQQD